MAPSDKMKRQEGPGITHLLKESKSNHSHKGKTLNRKKKHVYFMIHCTLKLVFYRHLMTEKKNFL